MKTLRISLACIFWTGITLLLLDISGALHGWLSWMAKVQFLPAVLALNTGVIIGLVLLTLLFGRIYCSVICPLGVFQDGVAHIRVARERRHGKRKPYRYRKEIKWLRYGVWVLFIAALIAGVHAFVAILAPYSAWGRIVQNLLQPVYIWGNNLIGGIAAHFGSYAFYDKEVWLRSIPAFAVAAATFIAVVVLAWTGGRTWCNTVCPVGTTLGFLSRFSMFRPVIDTEKCRNCKVCEHNCKASCIDIDSHKIDYSRCVDCFNCLDDCKFGALKYRFAWKGKAASAASGEAASPARRAFVSGVALAAGSAALKAQTQKLDGGLAAIEKKRIPRRRTPITPPGSVSAANLHDHCTACQLCVAACPNDVLRPSTDLSTLMQPESSYERGWCRPECTTCSEVCPAGAILKITPEEKTAISIGHAVWHRGHCLPWKDGVECGNCARHCPAEAIIMVPSDADDPESVKIPAILEEKCIGCGACEYVCPSRPVSAIRVEGHDVHIKK